MGEAEIHPQSGQLVITSVFHFYGTAANEAISSKIAADISHYWNEPSAPVIIQNRQYMVRFIIEGYHRPDLTPEEVFENINPANNYFRIENTAPGNISFTDGLGCNTGYLLLANLLQSGTTAAHEYGHTLGLAHPAQLDIRGKGVPGIMYPRGTITDPAFQYSPQAIPHAPGGTMNPEFRKVTKQDIDALRLHRLRYNQQHKAMVGEFSSLWHESYER